MKEKIVREIEMAFAGNVYPGDEKLFSNLYDENCEILKNHFRGQKDWQSLNAEFIDQDGALAFFSNEAYLFFLPAFLIADLNLNLDYNDPAVSLCWSFTDQSENIKLAKTWGGNTISEQSKERFKHFTHEQVSVIVSYLQWRLSLEDDLCIRQALKNYWLPCLDQTFSK